MFNNLDLNTQLLFIIAVGSAVIALIAIIMTLYLSSKMRKFQKAYISLQTFLSGTRLEDILRANLKEVRELGQQFKDNEARLSLAESKLRGGIDRAELVRFNSFQNMGSDLSFALALLNQEGTGVILTGIHSIEECRIYAKPVEKGQGLVRLNDEEKLAIERACKTIKV